MFIKTKQLDKPENGGPIIHPQFEQFDNCKHKIQITWRSNFYGARAKRPT